MEVLLGMPNPLSNREKCFCVHVIWFRIDKTNSVDEMILEVLLLGQSPHICFL